MPAYLKTALPVAGLRVLLLLAVCNLLWTIPIAAQPTLEFSQLPSEIQNRAIEVRKICKEAIPEMEFNDMQGIQVLDLKGDGSRDIVVDSEWLCGRRITGAGCSNRACDFAIYKEGPKGQWRKIFDEQLYDKYLAIDWEHRRLQLMVVSIGAADPRCHPDAKRFYTTGMSCNLIVTYRNNKWNWRLIR
jgi:hypothetical protein